MCSVGNGAEAGQGGFQALQNWWLQGSMECPSLRDLHGGNLLRTDRSWACGPWGSSQQGREVAQTGIQNPLDQSCPVTPSEKLEKQ